MPPRPRRECQEQARSAATSPMKCLSCNAKPEWPDDSCKRLSGDLNPVRGPQSLRDSGHVWSKFCRPTWRNDGLTVLISPALPRHRFGSSPAHPPSGKTGLLVKPCSLLLATATMR
jgi:hypothetical protein